MKELAEEDLRMVTEGKATTVGAMHNNVKIHSLCIGANQMIQILVVAAMLMEEIANQSAVEKLKMGTEDRAQTLEVILHNVKLDFGGSANQIIQKYVLAAMPKANHHVNQLFKGTTAEEEIRITTVSLPNNHHRLSQANSKKLKSLRLQQTMPL